MVNMVPHEAFACRCAEGDVVLRQSYKPESYGKLYYACPKSKDEFLSFSDYSPATNVAGENIVTMTIDIFPGDKSLGIPFPSDMSLGKTPTCREASLGILSPATRWVPVIFQSKIKCHGGTFFPSDMSLGKAFN
ncbi:hypothetical protein Tco_1471582 [Tanacetum coccineum]